MELTCTQYFDCNPTHQTLYSSSGNLEFIRCSDCGLIWRSTGSMEIIKNYSSGYFDSKRYHQNRKHKVKKSGWLLDIALESHNGIRNMLEVGCSVGNTLEAAKIRDIDHLGIDISEFAVGYCRAMGLKAEKRTLEEMLSDNQRYDLIFMQHVLEHFTNPFEILGNCRRLLTENGLMLIMVPNTQFRPALKKRENHRFYSMEGVGTEHFVYFDYHSLTSVLNSCHFEVIQKNYPVWISGADTPSFFLNRLGRKCLALFGADQELLIIAQKK